MAEEDFVNADQVQLELVKIKYRNRYEIFPIKGRLSIDDGVLIVKQACELLTRKTDGLIFVGVAGLSGAGTTLFTEKLLNAMPGIAVISLDNYNDPSSIVNGNFGDYQTDDYVIDYDTLSDNLRGLNEGRAVEGPIYDFKSNSRVGYSTIEVPRSRVVVLEGIFALNKHVRYELDLGVSVIGGVYFELSKWVSRAISRCPRKQTEEIIQKLNKMSDPMDRASIELGLETAHVTIGNFNPSSGIQPTHILKSTRVVSAAEIKSVISEEYHETTEETYDLYLLPPFEDPESSQSYLRIRNTDRKYSVIFEEWVIDDPFIESQRSTFEVSVRFFDGLMSMGYTIAAVLKRRSHIIFDARVRVKTDCLEQLNLSYVQVQGGERLHVKHIAERLGLDGSYVSLTDVQQIQREKRDIIALPDDLKRMLRLDDVDFASSPKEAVTKAIAARRRKYLNREESSLDEETTLSRQSELALNNGGIKNTDSPATVADQGINTRVLEQLSMLNKRMERIEERTCRDSYFKTIAVPSIISLAIGGFSIVLFRSLQTKSN